MSRPGPSTITKCEHSRFNSYDQTAQTSTTTTAMSAQASKRCVSSISAIDPRQLSVFLNEMPANVSDYRFRVIQDNKHEESIYTEPTLAEHHQDQLAMPLPTNHEAAEMAEWKAPARPELGSLDVVAPTKNVASHLTITGQDMAITLDSHNGQMTQTVLGESSMPLASVPLNAHLLQYYSSRRVEFLPLCDLLFNIISLIAYFCDVVFDSVTAYTFYLNGHYGYFVIVVLLILFTAVVSQLLSYNWYARERKFERKFIHPEMNKECQSLSTLPSQSNLRVIHICLCGVLWRYFKLFTPVNLVSVKKDVRDLCVLRMVHAFCQAAPIALLQLQLAWRRPSPNSITDLSIISIFLSIFSICWALSSFSKNIRHGHIHKLVLTWLGVIFQFMWRLGTITSRLVSLTIYATVYTYWLFAVLFLHWFSVILWLLSQSLITTPIGPQDAKKNSFRACFTRSAILAFVYIFCFINMDDANPRFKMIAYYATMFIENILLLSISLYFDPRVILWYRKLSYTLVIGGFFFGMFFAWLYYRFFHIRHLKHSLRNVESNSLPHSHGLSEPNMCNDHLMAQSTNQLIVNNCHNPFGKLINSVLASNANVVGANGGPSKLAKHRLPYSNENVPGVFNCSLNPALKRKKKKPSTVPPPPRASSEHQLGGNLLDSLEPIVDHTQLACDAQLNEQSSANTFWRKSNRNQTTAQSPLAPTPNGFKLSAKHPFSSSLITPASPIDSTQNGPPANHAHLICKAHQSWTDKRPVIVSRVNETVDNSLVNCYYHPKSKKMMVRSQTPEVLLVPHADNSRVFYNYPSSVISIQSNNQAPSNHDLNNFLFYANQQDRFDNDEDDATFISRFQRPPVPGREGGDEGKKKENDYNNASYEEGKRSLVNYGIDKTRLEKLLQKKARDKHSKSSTSINKLMSRSKKKVLTKKRSKTRQSQQLVDSMDSTSSSCKRNSSSGEEGDIESDINPAIELSGELARPANLYDKVHQEEEDEPPVGCVADNQSNSRLYASKSSANLLNSPNSYRTQTQQRYQQQQPKIIRGSVHQYKASMDNTANTLISNYHLGSNRFSTQGLAPRHPRALYHSAKYKRHNTPL